jgi:hypothetical protein
MPRAGPERPEAAPVQSHRGSGAGLDPAIRDIVAGRLRSELS